MRIQSLTRAAAVLLCLGLVAIGGWFLLESPAQPPVVAVAEKAKDAKPPAPTGEPLTLTVGKHYKIWVPNTNREWPGLGLKVIVMRSYSNGWIDAKLFNETNPIVAINLAHITQIEALEK